MSAVVKRRWTPVAIEPPALSNNKWYLSSLVGVILIVAAFLQIISFQDFSNNFSAMGLSSANWWAGGILLAEIWAAAGFFKIRLSYAFRAVSNFMAVVTVLLWFTLIAWQVAQHTDVDYRNLGLDHSLIANLFGKYLPQTLNWWPVIEITAFGFLVVYCLEMLHERSGAVLPIVTKVSRKKSR